MSDKYLVVGDDGVNSLGIIRSLGEQKYFPDAIITYEKSKRVSLQKSKYLSKCILVKKTEDALIDAIMKYYENNEDNKVFVIPTSDFVLTVLSDNYSRLCKRFVLPSVKYDVGTIKDIMSKSVMIKYAEMAGFDIPVSLRYIVTNDILNDIKMDTFSELKYPLIIKSDSIVTQGCDFKIVYNQESLVEFLNKNIGSEVLIQEYIEDAEEIAVQGVAYGAFQEPGVFGIINKMRTSVFSMGTTTYANIKIAYDNKIIDLVKFFIKEIEYNGIFDVELLLKGDKVYFIECNFRNGAYGYAHTVMGANLPFLWIDGLNSPKGKYNAEEKCSLREIVFINDIGDLAHVIRHNVNLFTWIWQYITADAHLTFNFKDQGPFWAEIDLPRLIKSIKKR